MAAQILLAIRSRKRAEACMQMCANLWRDPDIVWVTNSTQLVRRAENGSWALVVVCDDVGRGTAFLDALARLSELKRTGHIRALVGGASFRHRRSLRHAGWDHVHGPDGLPRAIHSAII